MNGSEGVLRALDLGSLKDGSSYAKVAVVEFPKCPIHLDGLPPSHFPVYPSTTSITTILCDRNGHQFPIVMTRQQLPLQLGFASTVHGAQGRTLDCIGADLNLGGAKSYVIASRARNLASLVLVRPVSLQRLNTPLDRSLEQEVQRLHALEHNTLVQLGLIVGLSVPVPDSESGFLANSKPASITLTVKSRRPRTTTFPEQRDGGMALPASPVVRKRRVDDSDSKLSENGAFPPALLFCSVLMVSIIQSQPTLNQKPASPPYPLHIAL